MTMTPMNALFHQATTLPDGIAVIYDDVVWTYHDLLPTMLCEAISLRSTLRQAQSLAS